jgi:hypothetical protein
MSIFPTRILLATDGAKEAELATTTSRGLDQDYRLRTARPQRRRGARRTRRAGKIENLGGAVARGHARSGDVAKEVLNLAE